MAYRDQVRIGNTHGRRGRYNRTGIAVYQRPATCVVTGTALACLESEIVTGGQTIILTLDEGQWNKNTAAFEAARQAVIDGMVSDKGEAAGWLVEVTGNAVVGSVVRTSDVVVTVTLAVEASYATTLTETITITIPAAALEGQIEALACNAPLVVTTGS